MKITKSAQIETSNANQSLRRRQAPYGGQGCSSNPQDDLELIAFKRMEVSGGKKDEGTKKDSMNLSGE